MSRRKDKLEASLEGLFSSKKQPKINADITSLKGQPETGESNQRSPEAPFTLSEESRDSISPTPINTDAIETDIPSDEINTAIIEVKSSPISDVAPNVVAIIKTSNIPITEDKPTVQNQTTSPQLADYDENLQIVTFRLQNDYYGVDIADVQTIIKTQLICPVPFTPDFVEGLINLRGQIVPIINLRKRLGMPEIEVDDNSRLIIVTTHNESAGIRVDEVSGVNTLPKSVIEPATSFITATESNLLASIARTDRHLILILDITAIFNIAEKATKHSF